MLQKSMFDFYQRSFRARIINIANRSRIINSDSEVRLQRRELHEQATRTICILSELFSIASDRFYRFEAYKQCPSYKNYEKETV